MKAVITPFVQKELGLATFKVDQEVRKLVEAGRKFIMEPVPRELIEHMEDGLVVTEQTMATNEALQPFFNSDELFRRIGGIDALVAWLRGCVGKRVNARPQIVVGVTTILSTLNEIIARCCCAGITITITGCVVLMS